MSQGQQDQSTGSSQFNALTFLVKQILNRANIATVVRVEAVTNDGGLSPVGFVDVTPLVNQLDGQNNAVPHITVYGLPYMRLQGGANAVIIDPQPGDIGVAVFADRDISAVKVAKAQANPGTKRRNNMADGMYFGGMLNGTPSQYMRFSNEGVEIVSTGIIRLSGTGIVLDAPVSATSTIQASGDITAGAISSEHHLHSGVQSGGSNSGPPV